MTIEEARKLSNGLYRINWQKGHGWSYASVGRLCDGTPWFAPTNWVSDTPAGICCVKWDMVRSVKLIKRRIRG